MKENLFLLQKEKGNTFTLLIIFTVKSLQKEKTAQILYYEGQSAGINLQSPQIESTPRTLTLDFNLQWNTLYSFNHTL